MSNIYTSLKKIKTHRKVFAAWRLIFAVVVLMTFFQKISPAFADDFLPPEKAFVGNIESVEFDKNENSANINILYDIFDNYYLYKDKTKVSLDNTEKVLEIESVILPNGEFKNDENFGKVEVFFNQLQVIAKIKLLDNQNTNTNTNTNINFLQNFLQTSGVNISVQGCANNGICYPPLLQNMKFDGEISVLEIYKNNSQNLVENNPQIEQINETSKIANLLSENKNLSATLLFFFLAGLGLSFTPCVLPMIPILSAMLAKQSPNQTQTQNNSVILSIIYVFGMCLTYTILGVIAGLTGTLLNHFLQNAYTLIAISVIFVLLSLSMFGFYELQLPSSWQNKINKINKFNAKNSIFMMGVLSALVVSPCVAAPLAGALLYIGQSGNAIFGGVALFCLSLGMGVPLIAVGIAGKSLLPKTGVWMLQVKKFFGVIMLAMALWILRPLLSPMFWILVWALLFIFWGIFLKALDSLPAEATSWQRFFKACGFIILLVGILLFVGAISGAKDILNPLSEFKQENQNINQIQNQIQKQTQTQTQNIQTLNFENITNQKQLNNILQQNKNNFVMLEFSADWCISCKEIERDVFTNQQVINALQEKSVRLFKIDVTENSAEQRELLQKFNLFGPPGILFFHNENELQNLRIVGYKNAEEFLQIVKNL